jgi:TolB-like protein/Tfp pilus assembly protein PilF
MPGLPSTVCVQVLSLAKTPKTLNHPRFRWFSQFLGRAYNVLVLFNRDSDSPKLTRDGNLAANATLAADTVLHHLKRIVASPSFITSPQLCRFLRFVVAREVGGQGDQLKEYSVGLEVFGKDASFDPRIDPVVRTEARRLRHKLAEYYDNAGQSDEVEIDLPKGGYRPVFSLRPVAPSLPTSEPISAGFLRLKSLIIAALLLAAAIAGVYWLAMRSKPSSAVSPLPSIAVLPLENLSSDPEQEYFSDGMTDELITDLAKIRGLRVISRTSVLRFKKGKRPLAEIAQQLGVDYVVEGTILPAGDRMRITAQLIAARNEHHVWAESYQRNRGDALALQGEVARTIAAQINIRVTPQEQGRLSSRPVQHEAQEHYLKGRFYWHSRDPELVQKSVEYFNQAIARDPGYALAYAGLGDAYQVIASRGGGLLNDNLERARTAAKKAIELDGNLGEAHACLGGIYISDWNWQDAEREFRKAIELSPSYPTAHSWYGDLLGDLGRTEESLAEARRALELDPLSPGANSFLGVALFNAKQYDPAIRQLQQTVEAFPRMMVAHLYLSLAYAGKRMYPEAIQTAQKVMNLTNGAPDAIGLLGYAQSAAGNKKEAQRLLDDVIARKIDSPFILAGLYMDVGDKERALGWLEKGITEHSHLIEVIKVSPVFAGLHEDAKFTTLLKRMKLVD